MLSWISEIYWCYKFDSDELSLLAEFLLQWDQGYGLSDVVMEKLESKCGYEMTWFQNKN